MRLDRLPALLFAVLALALLLMTLLWQIPMMLWDHLNLVPMLNAWHEGELLHSAFLGFDGAHIHVAAYAVLLVTANLSHGHPWLADTVSWVLLLATAVIVLSFIRATVKFNTQGRVAMATMLVFLTLYPGHLANLQWGWQVAVFLCLFGVAVVIWSLTRPRLSWPNNLIALIGAALSFCSFATALAIFPVALLLITLRYDQSRGRRALMAIPWFAACLGIALVYRRFANVAMDQDVPTELYYLANFLGAGISRLATDIAPWLGSCGVILAAWAVWRCRREQRCLPWIGLAAFGLLAGVLIALGRDAALGPNQAFVSRYVSFSIFFWLGLFGLLCSIHIDMPVRGLRAAMVVIAAFACANALQLMHRAERLGVRTGITASTIRETWPHVDKALLARIYFDKPRVAFQRLGKLRSWGYAPFDKPAPVSTDKPIRARAGN